LQHGWMQMHGVFLTQHSRPPSSILPSPLHTTKLTVATSPLGRIGDADGIIESVLVEDNKMHILPNNHRAMPSYRLCTSDGPIQVTESLAGELRTVLEDVALGETSSHSP
ncbi:hypothetical protein EDC04DRAFT_2517270, partial [Pisolithus marmoratus]